MNLLKNPVLNVVATLALAIALVAGCSDTPQDPNANVPPETNITTYGISTAPDSATFYNVTVYWNTSDPDGQDEYYRYWVDQADLPNEQKIETFDAHATVRMNFDGATTAHTFYVQARDNQNVWDPTPASITINIADVRNTSRFNPITLPVTVPPNGAITSRGVHFVIDGTDLDGSVTNFQRAIDDTAAWVTVAPTFILARNSTIELDLTPDDITLGPHIVYVRAVDNFGNVDESPMSISFVAVDTLRPDLSVISGAIPNAFYFLPQGGSATDVATQWAADASWYYSTLRYRYAVDDSATWSPWIVDDTVTLSGLAAGPHQFFIQAQDQAFNTTTFSTNFGVGTLTGERGVLVVNGISWSDYTPQPEDMYAGNGPFGTLPIAFWDVFEGSESFYPANIAPVFVGSGMVPGDTLGHYSSMVMVMNAFGGDDAIYTAMLPLIMSYLNGGGNILLTCRYGGAIFITGDLLTYGLTPGNTLEFNQVGVNHRGGGLVPAVDGLGGITGIGSWSLSDLLAPPTDPAVTTLYTTPDFPGSVGGIVIQPEGKGKFAFVAGRPYRFVASEMAADFEYILRHYFGEGE